MSKGERKATPRPPFVMASSTPWGWAVARNRYKSKRKGWAKFRNTATKTENHGNARKEAAKTSECVNPRCPQKSPYGMPKRKSNDIEVGNRRTHCGKYPNAKIRNVFWHARVK